ncbi:hypothetical protein CYLTODRAFT_225662 [Cylindrobasidium torrendii FP15055 ss-10]|uniref:Protein SYM1 n=1 Tax=Cylindrobasidium torrendii FP15055 ss-10 TaxID=1314674 RepID=A0A0D7BG84_9AGAR|nr:hypothetical protein CYLTODRAFT_225662 [Cylindrobasidium torrendii FP15055 ss-10]
MASLFRKYNALLVRRPLLTQCASAAVLFGSGDLIAQQVIEKKGSKHDLARTARLAFYGGAIFGPPITKWFQFLGRIQSKSPLRGTFVKVWLDQAVMAPMAVGVFFSSIALLEGKPNEIVPRLKDKYRQTVLMNWGVFIPTQMVNFWVVPPHLRFVFMGVVSLFWNTYLSYVNGAAERDVEETTAVKEVKQILPGDL